MDYDFDVPTTGYHELRAIIYHPNITQEQRDAIKLKDEEIDKIINQYHEK